jgi:DNA-binding NtrC family response regulator
MKILIVEDESLIAMDISDTLKEAGDHQVILAGSTAKALEHLKRETFDVAVLDMNLRGETAESVVNACANIRVPFLILSGYNARQIAEALPNAPVLAKPYSAAVLVRAVERVARKPPEMAYGHGALQNGPRGDKRSAQMCGRLGVVGRIGVVL